MSMCPDCGYVYDESEYGRCPRCSGKWKMMKIRHRLQKARNK